MVTIDERSTVRQLSRDLDKAHRLIQAQGIIRLALSRLSRYRFRHIMIQKYLYSGLDEAERAYLHEAVGNVLEQLYKDDTERIAVQLARHFHIAGLAAKAIGYLQQAGEQAAQRYAYHEAITHFKDALTALDTLPQTPELIRQELSLQFAMGRALTAIKGMADAETGAAFDRCRSLAQEVGDVPERFPILFGVWSNLLVRGNIKAAHELGQEFLHLAQAQEETVPFLVGHRMLGFTAFLIGDFPGSRTEFEQAMAIPQTDEPTGLAALYSMDPWVARVTMVCCNLLLLGHPDQALAMSAAALQAAEKSSHPYTMAYTLLAAGAWFHQYRQDAVLVLQHAEALISLSRTHGFQFWLAWGNFLRGWALSVQGEPGEGIPLMREGLHSFQNTGAGLMLSHFQALLAEVYGQIGQTEAGLTVLADGLNTVALNDEHFWEAELLRLRGELLLQQGVVDEEEVEQQFQLAVSLAQRQQAKLLELRALASWSRLRISQGRGPHPELAIVIDWFDEGLDSADLVQAKALLDSH
jgi:predicted ATPase